MARRLLALLDGLLNLATMLVIVVVGAYAGYALWDNQQIYASVENVQADMLLYKNKAEDGMHAMFEELRAINPDVQAWLELDETKIDYPLLYGNTNSYYLSRNVYRDFALAGSLFIDTRCNKELRNCYSLIHGHHMANRMMFGDLDLYKKKDFFWENRTGTVLLPDRKYELRTLAVLITHAVHEVIFEPQKWADDIEEPLLYAKEVSLYKDDEMIERLLLENEEAKKGNGRKPQLMVMATCSSESDAARTVLLCEMIPVEETE